VELLSLTIISLFIVLARFWSLHISAVLDPWWPSVNRIHRSSVHGQVIDPCRWDRGTIEVGQRQSNHCTEKAVSY
jgi:hypothetical protein